MSQIEERRPLSSLFSRRHAYFSTEQLLTRLHEIQEENDVLRAEVDLLQRRDALMREGLKKARQAIEFFVTTNKLRERSLKSFLQDNFTDHRFKNFIRSARIKPSRRDYITRAALEALVLKTAQKKVLHIGRVFIDFDLHQSDPAGSNWRICGVTSGIADPVDAMTAAREAANQHNTMVMVEDGSPLVGGSPSALRLVSGHKRI